MNLGVLRQRLDSRLSRAEALFVTFAPTVKKNCRHDQVVFLDGLLSYTWQAWGRFCRDLMLHSCIGAETTAGIVLPATVSPATIERVSYLAIQAKKNKPALPGVINNVWRYEPTWGDVAAFTKKRLGKVGPGIDENQLSHTANSLARACNIGSSFSVKHCIIRSGVAEPEST